jgi:4-amino-4-deoxy-L-arabinose transferase-like glycosyltransferase
MGVPRRQRRRGTPIVVRILWSIFLSRMKHDRFWIAVITALFVILGVVYSLATPIFEASDELWHYPVVKYIADDRGLPVQRPGVETMWQQEGSQPPAYYALAALVTAWIHTDDLPEVRRLNPMANTGRPLAAGNKNLIIHTQREAFPWHGTALAIHLIRFLSVLLSASAVYLTYRLALEIAPRRSDLALAAAILVAFNPMFLFISGSVNNDNLIVPLATLILWLVLRTLREGWMGNGRAVLLGLLLGTAALTKLSGLALLPLTAAVLIIVAARRQAWGALLRWGAIIGASVILVAGWWYLRNWQLYGDPTGLSVMLDIAGHRPEQFTLHRLQSEFQGFRLSYWGVFGGFDVIAPQPIYWFYDLLVLAGLAGWAGWLLRRPGGLRSPTAERLLVLTVWVLLVLVALIRWTAQTYASQGRLTFPAIGAIAILVSFGLAGWVPRRWQGRGMAAVSVVLFLLAAAIPLAVIRPAYARPPILSAGDVPPSIQPSGVTHGGVLRLLGYDLPRESVRPGETVPVTVYWQLTAPSDRDLAVFVHLLGRGGEPVGQSNSYPGLGAYPLSLLQPGDVVRDTYQVPVVVTATAPSLLQVDVGLFDLADPARVGLSVRDTTGAEGSGTIGAARLLPYAAVSDLPQTPRFDLGGQAALVGYDFPQSAVHRGDTLPVTLFWQAQARMADDYQVFVHLMGPDGQSVAQGDKTPLDGDWPTSAWEPGQTFRDVYRVQVPDGLAPGAYELRAGLYRLADVTRLPVQGPEGRVADSAIILGQVQVR